MLKNTKKIGILTLNGYNNYGNRLQNYALEEILRSMDFEVETILVDRNNQDELSKRLRKISSFKGLLGKIQNRFKLLLSKKIMNERKEKFIKFSKDYLFETDYIISNNIVPDDISSKYDFFITGSDQVWNPNNLHGTTFYFLPFAPFKKRIAYAPSFGVSELPDELKKNYSKWLGEMTHISVREDDGANIIKDLTGRTAPVLVDPTLLLTKEKWLKISKEAPNKPKREYLLTYFLGGIPEEFKKQIRVLAKKSKLEIINLGDIKEKDTYRTGPSEFIDYIHNSSFFLTDSFHGAVFSIIFEKPFLVFERAGTISMYSRIDTLLNKFDLSSRKIEYIKSNEDIFKIDFSHVIPILEVERKKALEYLKNALEIEVAE